MPISRTSPRPSTITKPTLSTTAVDGLDADKNLIGEGDVTIVDTVKYKNVTPGKTYKVSGTLYEKVTDKDGKVSKKQLLDADGNPVTAETEFVPDDTYGTVDVTFTFDASDLKAKDKVVAFESLSLTARNSRAMPISRTSPRPSPSRSPRFPPTAVDGLDADKNLIGEGDVYYRRYREVQERHSRQDLQGFRHPLRRRSPTRTARSPRSSSSMPTATPSPPRPSSFPMIPTAPSM